MHRLIPAVWLVLALCLSLSAATSATAKDKKDKKEEAGAEAVEQKAPAKKVNVVQLRLRGSYPEGPTSLGLFGEMQPSLAATIRKIDQAAEDEDVAALWLQIEDIATGRGKIHELRSAITRFRKTGKPAYAQLTSAETGSYLLAAACDEIVMPPSGMLIVPGVRAEVTFYKGLLDKLGVEFDMLQMGQYKGAAEPYTRTSMSPPMREILEGVLDDTYENMVTTIAADRKLDVDKVKEALDQGLFTADAAQKAGLVDQVDYADLFEKSLLKKLDADELHLVTDYRKKKVDTDFSGMSGMFKLMELMMGGSPSKSSGTKTKIAVVYAVGPIMLGSSATDMFGSQSLGSTSLVAALRKAVDDPKVVAIVLRIDSPGGSAVASDLIWRETERIEKPIIASMGDVAGSGGYYIAMGADRILAEPGTVTGSIGVVGGKLVLGGLYDKLGITTEVISRGRNSGSFSSNSRFTPEEREAWTAMLEETYRQFVTKAAEGRGLKYDELEALAQGRIYTGRMAVANGLIDQLGTLRDAIAEAKKAAKLDPDEPVELLILPRPKTIFEQLFGDPTATSAITPAVLSNLEPELLQAIRKASAIKQLFTEPTLLWMPYEVEIK